MRRAQEPIVEGMFADVLNPGIEKLVAEGVLEVGLVIFLTLGGGRLSEGKYAIGCGQGHIPLVTGVDKGLQEVEGGVDRLSPLKRRGISEDIAFGVEDIAADRRLDLHRYA